MGGKTAPSGVLIGGVSPKKLKISLSVIALPPSTASSPWPSKWTRGSVSEFWSGPSVRGAQPGSLRPILGVLTSPSRGPLSYHHVLPPRSSLDHRRRKSPCSWGGHGFPWRPVSSVCATDSACTAGRRGTSSGSVRSGQKVRLTRGRVLVSRTDIHPPWGLESLTVGALLDSGADKCLIDVTLARQAGIPLKPMEATL